MKDKNTFNVIFNDDITLSHYDNLLKRFPQWKSFQREIKLSSLLEGKRVQYDISDIIGQNMIYGTLGPNSGQTAMLKDVAFKVDNMSFIINGNNVDELKIQIKTLENNSGKQVESLIDSNCELGMYQSVLNNEVMCFYIDQIIQKKAA